MADAADGGWPVPGRGVGGGYRGCIVTRWMRDHPHVTALAVVLGLFVLGILGAFALVGVQAWNTGCSRGL